MKLISKKEDHKFFLTINEDISDRESLILVTGIKKIIDENFREIEINFQNSLPNNEACFLIDSIRTEMKINNNYLILKFNTSEMKELYETKVIFYKNSKELSKLKAQFKSLNITEFREIKNKNLQLQLKLKKYNEILHSFRLHTQIQPLDSKQLEPIVQLHESLKNILINNNLIESNET